MKIHVVGAGDIGRYIAGQLSDLKNDVVLIDISPTAISNAEEKLDVMTATGDATCRTLLKSAGVEKSDLFVAVSGLDGVNILASALAAEMGAKMTLARVDSPNFFMDPRGFERGLLKTTILACAPRLVSFEMLRRFRCQFVSQVDDFAENTLTLGAARLGTLHEDLLGESSDLKKLADRGVCGVIRDGAFYNIHEVSGLYESDMVAFLGPHKEFSETLRSLRHEKWEEKVILIGGGDVGGELARLLYDDGHQVTVIDINHRQCEKLAERLPRITVLHGDGTNISTLEEEHAEKAKSLFAVTKADEVNLMASLLGKDLGVPLTFALIHRPGYASVYEKLGVTGTTSSHGLLYQSVDWMNSLGWVMRKKAFVEPNIEVAEVYLRDGSGLDGQNLFQLNIPKDIQFVGGALHGQYISPAGSVPMKTNGYYIFIGEKGLADELEKHLTKASST